MDSSNSSEESSVSSSDYSTESSDEDGMETAQINGTRLLLPQGLCDKEDIFKEFFSPHLWNSLSDDNKTHLQTLLPRFPENDEEEKTVTLQRLFNFEDFKFSNPLEDFHKHLKAGYFRPDIARMRNMIKKAEFKEAKRRYKNHQECLKNEVLESRGKLLNQIRNLPPGCEPKVEKVDVTDIDLIRHRTKRRYFQILSAIRSKTEDGSSSDENYLENNSSVSLSRKQKRHLNSIKNSLQNSSDKKFVSTFTGKTSTCDLERYITPSYNPFYLSEESYKNILRNHKKRKQEDHDEAEFNTRNISLSDVIHRTQLPYLKMVQVQPSKSSVNNNSNSEHNNKTPSGKKKLKRETNHHHHNHHNYHHNHNQSSVVVPPPLTPTTARQQSTTPNSELGSDSDSVIIDAVTVVTPQKPTNNKKTENNNKNIMTVVSATSSNMNNYNRSVSSSSGSNSKSRTVINPFVPKPVNVEVKIEVKEEPEEGMTATPTVVVPPVKQEPVTSSSSSSKNNNNMITPISSYSQYGKIMPVTLSDLEGIDMMNLPIDLDNSDIDILEVNNKPELMQETHSNFLSLVRDIICSTNEHRMDFATLEKRLQTWQESPISPLNDWYSSCDNWVGLLRSAVNFLCGNCVELPNDFVPYLEHKQQMELYQWIGAGRDGDNLLAPLCRFWLEHRDEIKGGVKVKEEVDVEISDRTQTPPPPRCPTNWTLRKATNEEIETFREQEKKRYENPHRAFTYACNGYESVVAPLKGIYNPASGANAKARGHTILVTDRPNFVTILSLVRDATARLPNGEGTRGDIVELLKHSQYISAAATDNVLQTVVSGALDRMHTQFDPCVKYDTKRKIWIYLHRNRSEEDFEKIHQHLQGAPKIPKKANKKSPSKSKVKQSADKQSSKTSKESNAVAANTATSSTSPATSNNNPIPDPPLHQPNPAERPPAHHPVPSNRNNAKKTGVQNVVKAVTTATNSLLISNNVLPQQQQREPASPPTIQILENNCDASKSLEEQEINEALQAIVENRIGSPKTIKTTKAGLVKILSPHNKSMLVKQDKGGGNQQHQLVQITGTQKQMIHAQIVQKQDNLLQETDQKLVSKPSQAQPNVVPVVQHLKNVTLLKNSNAFSNTPPAVKFTAAPSGAEVQSVTVTIGNKPTLVSSSSSSSSSSTLSSVTEQMASAGIQIKTPNNLTPAQQQQILQTIKQKILPQTVLASQQHQQQQLLLKQQKMALKQGAASGAQVQAAGISLLGQTNKLVKDSAIGAKTGGIVSTQAPVVAKVLTNAAGQVISVESLLAHQKQQGTTIRVSGTKGGQPNIIHLTGASRSGAIAQFAVASQNNLLTLTTQPKLVVAAPAAVTTVVSTTSAASAFAKASNRGGVKTTAAATSTMTVAPQHRQLTKLPAKVTQQLINAKIIQNLEGGIGAQKVVQPKLLVGQGGQVKLTTGAAQKATTLSLTGANAIRMVNAANLNLTHIGGKPVLLASKGTTLQNLQGQNVILQTQTSAPSLVLQNPKTLQSVATAQPHNINMINHHHQNVVLTSQNVKLQQQNNNQQNQQPTTAQVVFKSAAPNHHQGHHLVLGGQPVRLGGGNAQQTQQATPTAQRLVLATSQGQGGQIVAQQILLPAGFQGTAINIKALQGVKVIPIAQAHGQARSIQSRQLFARVVNPAITKAVAQQQQSTSSVSENIDEATSRDQG